LAFADPQSITVATVAQVLNNTGRGLDTASYKKEDGSQVLTVSHAYSKDRARRRVRLDYNALVADAIMPSVNIRPSGSISIVMDNPKTGFTNTQIKDEILALVAWLTAANITKVLGGES